MYNFKSIGWIGVVLLGFFVMFIRKTELVAITLFIKIYGSDHF